LNALNHHKLGLAPTNLRVSVGKPMISDVMTSRPIGIESNNKPVGLQSKDDTTKTSFATFSNEKALEDKQKMAAKSQASSDKDIANDDLPSDGAVSDAELNEPSPVVVDGQISGQEKAQSHSQESPQENSQEGPQDVAQNIGLVGTANFTAASFYTHTSLTKINPDMQAVIALTTANAAASVITEALTYTGAKVATDGPNLQGIVAPMSQDVARFTPMPGLIADLGLRSGMTQSQALSAVDNSGLLNPGSLNSGSLNSGSLNPSALNPSLQNSSSQNSSLQNSNSLNPASLNPKAFSPGLVSGSANASFMIKGADMAAQSFSNTLAAGTLAASVLGPMALADASSADVADINSPLFSQLLARGTPNPSVSQWGPVPVNMAGSLTQQAQNMLTPLREQLRFQIDQQIKHAEIRLDPPELGKLELNIRLDGDKLQVQIHAANPAIRDALLSGLDRLRADLAQEYGGTLDVDVGQGESRQQKDPEQGRPMAIAMNSSDALTATKSRDKAQQSQLNLLA
jgi:flagellar hook-length control protein FliK